jgi:hypothetical protein
MALYPKAILRLLPENNSQGKITPRAIIMHSAGGESELYGWWMNDQSRGLESHFWVSRDGDVYQYMDTRVRADANGDANGFAISIETQSTKHASEEWDPAQMAAIIELCDWICATHDIPRRAMKTATDSGIAWHVQFGAPGPWTGVKGKVCPGGQRIEQVKNVLIPALAAGTNPIHEDDDEMSKEDSERLAAMDLRLKALENEVIGTRGAKGDTRMDRIAEMLTEVHRKVTAK